MTDEPVAPSAGAVLYAKDLDRLASFYAAVTNLRPAGHDNSHVRLDAPGFELVIVRMAAHIAGTIDIAVPPVRRADVPVKLVFVVGSLAAARAEVDAHGGVMNPVGKEWRFHDWRVCDALDPEGNVVQFRERAR